MSYIEQGDRLCAACLQDLYIPAVLVTIGYHEKVNVPSGWELVEAVAELLAADRPVAINRLSGQLLYAHTQIGGTDFCGAHMPFYAWDTLAKMRGGR